MCSARLAEVRRNELESANQQHWAEGKDVLLVTLTFSHGPGDALRATVKALLAAYSRMTATRKYRDWREKLGIVHSVKALECTWGKEASWHPHVHVLLYAGRALAAREVAEVEDALFEQWERVMGRRGYKMNRRHGVKVQKGRSKIAEYVAKLRRDPKKRPWELSDELAKAGVKRGKGVRYTPFDLLTAWEHAPDAETRELFAGLWREYEDAMHGRAQLSWSPGAREYFELGRERDGEDGDAELPGEVEIARICERDFNVIVYLEKECEVLERFEDGGAEAGLAYVAQLVDLYEKKYPIRT